MARHLGLSLALLWASVAVAQPAAALPVEAFFKPARLQQAALSPSGRWVAALTRTGGKRMGLLIVDADSLKPVRFIQVSQGDDVSWFQWVSDDWLVGQLSDPANRGTVQIGGGLQAIRRDGSAARTLIARTWEPLDPTFRRRWLEPDHDFLATGAPGSNEVIVGQWVWRGGDLDRVVPRVLNVTTGAVRSLPDGTPTGQGWSFDTRGRPRLAFDTQQGVTTVWWADRQGAWRQLRKAPMFEAPWTVAALDGDDGLLVNTAAPGDGSLQIRRFDFEAGVPRAEALISTPGFDGEVLATHDGSRGALLGLTLLTEARSPRWFDERMQAVQRSADSKFPGAINLLQCRPCDGKSRVLVHSYSDTDPGLYALHLPGSDEWQVLGEARPEIDPARMAPMAMHRTRARDGHGLPLWVTRPLARSGPAPAVVLVHGGPWLRGRERAFDPEVQFLASRGYVVIEPEFRGSEGYGVTHFRAGWKQWGHKMQDDIADALKFAEAQGWARPGQACIMGSSYGGYAALMGLARDPGLYRCGIAHAAVSDPRHMYDFHWSDLAPAARRYSLPQLLGDREKDAALLEAGSPLLLAGRIQAPLLLVHGALDRRVPIANAERMKAALDNAGKPVQWVRYANEAHGFTFDDSRFDYYRRVEEFLARHLAP